MRELQIDPTLECFLGPASAFAEEELEKSILAEGCREPIVVLKGSDVILDGHRRYAICCKHGLPYEVEEIALPHKHAIRNWMIRRQGRRRNWDGVTESQFIATMVEGAPSKGGKINNVATATGKSAATVKRAARSAAALDRLHEEVRKKVESQKLKAGANVLRQLSRLPHERQLEVAAEVESGRVASLKAALENLPRSESGVNLTRTSEGSETHKPHEQSIKIHFEEGKKRLAKVAKHLLVLRDFFPSDRFSACNEIVRRLNEEIESWQEHAESKRIEPDR